MKSLTNILLFLLVIDLSNCFAVRDVFHYEQRQVAIHPLKMASIADLTFVGTIADTRKSSSFIADKVGNIYVVQVGDLIGTQPMQVIAILSDRIVLGDTLHFVVIK
jgi:Tfp pilus assembly protein PilP